MNRRQYLGAVVGVAGVSGCLGDSQASANSTSWDYEETVGGGGESVHEAYIGELDAGDSVVIEVVVERGRASRFDVLNRDTGEFAHDVMVYRSAEVEGYDPDDDGHVPSPYQTTIEIQEYGEYYARVAVPTENREVTLRYRVE